MFGQEEPRPLFWDPSPGDFFARDADLPTPCYVAQGYTGLFALHLEVLSLYKTIEVGERALL